MIINNKENENTYITKKIKKLKNDKNIMYKKNHILIIYKIIIIILTIINFLFIRKFKNNKSLNDIDKDEMIKMCYKSRIPYYIQARENQMVKSRMNFYNETKLITIQDKINYLTIHESPDYKSKIVDKILLHEYSKKMLNKDICVPILKIYKDTDEINLDELPDKFVLKCNHGSAMNIICTDKSNFNLKNAKFLLNYWKKINYGFISSEFQYLNVKRKIFAEIFLGDNIEDYKIYCFHGEPKYIRVQKIIGEYKVNNYYDLDWKLTDIETGIKGFLRKSNILFPKPQNFNKMIEYARKLTSEFAFVRADFYNIKGKIYLGEMTFTPSNLHFKLKNRNQSIYMGNFIDIKKIKSFLLNE